MRREALIQKRIFVGLQRCIPPQQYNVWSQPLDNKFRNLVVVPGEQRLWNLVVITTFGQPYRHHPVVPDVFDQVVTRMV